MIDRAVSTALYAAAHYIRKHGFSVHMGSDGCTRCMFGAIGSVTADERSFLDAGDYLVRVAPDLTAGTLRREGWTADDAIAALTIAADIAYAEGR